METVIQLDHIKKNYNIYKRNIQRVRGIFLGKEASEVKHALKDINLSIEKGERVLITGPVESGCSTLLSIIAGVIYPTKGKMKTKGSINAMLNVKAGLENEATCRENIYLKANVVGISRKVIDSKMDELIKDLQLEDYIDIALKSTPKGTPLKICLAVHLLKDADILLIDDNFSSGSSDVKEDCLRRIEEYLKDHSDVTMVISTNQLGFSKRVCTRGIILENGEITLDGVPYDAVERYKLIRRLGKNKQSEETTEEITDETIDEITEKINAEE